MLILKAETCPRCGGKLKVREEDGNSGTVMVYCEECGLNFMIEAEQEDTDDGKDVFEKLFNITFCGFHGSGEDPDDEDDSDDEDEKDEPKESVLADVYGVEVVRKMRKEQEESKTTCSKWNEVVGQYENVNDYLDSVMKMIDEMAECAIEIRKVLIDTKKYIHKAVRDTDGLMKKNDFFTKWAFDFREKDSEEVTAKQFKSDIYNILKSLNSFNAVEAGEIMAYAASHKIIEAE